MGPYVLYRHFDIHDRLLYVGMSMAPFRRLEDHKNKSHWFEQICTVRMEQFDIEIEAAAAEILAIRNEKPIFNKTHNSLPLEERQVGPNGLLAKLSGRERECLGLMGQGKTITQIAEALNLSVKTVSTYRTRCIQKLAMENASTVQIVDKARAFGLCQEASV